MMGGAGEQMLTRGGGSRTPLTMHGKKKCLDGGMDGKRDGLLERGRDGWREAGRDYWMEGGREDARFPDLAVKVFLFCSP